MTKRNRATGQLFVCVVLAACSGPRAEPLGPPQETSYAGGEQPGRAAPAPATADEAESDTDHEESLQAVLAAAPAPAPSSGAPRRDDPGGERYSELVENELVDVSVDALATFSLDVDTASYTIMRRDLEAGRLPRPESVRVEEYLNFFDFREEGPGPSEDAPFAVHLEAAPSPFGKGRGLLRVGVQARDVPEESRPAANLVFLVDVSGSMSTDDKIGLVQFSLTRLIESLRPDDTIGIVVYAGQEATLLSPTAVRNRGTLLAAIESLSTGGSTNGAGGIRAAYALASQHLRPGGINRVILCTDGDFNVGLTGDSLIALIEDYRERGITLTVLGFGRGNLNDRDMERLADHGNGNYAYVDGQNEALRVLSRDLAGTLQVVAQDVKVQVQFNDALVDRFRLVGYENRKLAHRDFDNDAVDAAEVGSGQFVTTFLEYELKPNVQPSAQTALAAVRVRYKEPGGRKSRKLTFAFPAVRAHETFAGASPSFRFGAAVAELAEILRRSKHSSGARFRDVIATAEGAVEAAGPDGRELVALARRAETLWPRQ